MRFRRSATLSLLLLAGIALVGLRVYRIWTEPLSTGRDLPVNPAGRTMTLAMPRSAKLRPLSIRSIISRNLFDPDRGKSGTKTAETPSVDAQIVQSFVLLGTMITPETSRALVRVPPTLDGAARGNNTAANSQQSPESRGIRRVKLGDELGGYQLASVEPDKVVFVKDSDRIELVLDYTRTVEQAPSPKATPKKATRRNPVRKALPRRGGRG